jgi:integrase
MQEQKHPGQIRQTKSVCCSPANAYAGKQPTRSIRGRRCPGWKCQKGGGKRPYHKKIVGTVERYPDENAARRCVVGLVSEINIDAGSMNSDAMTVAQLCDHFEQRELARENTWRSPAMKIVYKAYLTRWIRPHWQQHELAEVRTIQVEFWLRGLPLAKSSCAKIRNLLSVLFNHACRYELFDRNPIYLVRRSAKRRRAPTILIPL